MGRPRIFVTRRPPLDAQAFVGDAVRVEVSTLERPLSPAELAERATEAQALVTFVGDAVNGTLFNRCPALRIVANCAVGYDNVDVTEATRRRIWVTNTPDVLTEATADLTWALLLAVARRVGEGERMVRAGAFSGWSPTMLLGKELHGTTLGVFGFGRIGRAVARRAAGFGMEVLYAGRSSAPKEVEASLRARRVSKDELVSTSDVLTLHAPHTKETEHAIGAEELRRVKPGAILINTARGPLVDEAALAAALEHGALFGAGLDVYEREPEVDPGLVGRDDVVLLPHLGSATSATRRRMAEIALDNARRVLTGAEPRTPVNRLP